MRVNDAGPALVVPDWMTLPPAVTQDPSLRWDEVDVSTLANGLTFVVLPRPGLPLIVTQFSVLEGAAEDPASCAGRTALTSQLLDHAGTEATSPMRALENMGAEVLFSTAHDCCTATVFSRSDDQSRILHLLGQLVTHPSITPQCWNDVREAMRATFITRRHLADEIAAVVADRVLFGDEHPYGRPVMGFPKTCGSVTKGDACAQLHRGWSEAPGLLVMAGNIDVRWARQQVEVAFPRRMARATSGRIPAVAHPAPWRLTLVPKKGAVQTVVRVSFPAVATWSSQRAAVTVLSSILAGPFSSRLNRALRDLTGLTYGVVQDDVYLRDGGRCAVAVAFEPDLAPRGLRTLLDELDVLKTDLIGLDELEAAKCHVLAAASEAWETAIGMANRGTEIGVFGLPRDEPRRLTRAIGAVTAQTLQDCARTILDDSVVRIVAVGDLASLRSLASVEPNSAVTYYDDSYPSP